MNQLSHMIWDDVTTLGGGGSKAIDIPSKLPDPVQIVGCGLLEQSGIVPSGNAGLLMVKLDKGGRFCNGSSYPPSEDGAFSDELLRLVVLDLQPGGKRYKFQPHHIPVIASRKRGDKLLIDLGGTGGMTIQACPSILYIEEEVVPGFGSWSQASYGTGRSVNATYPKFGLRFTAPTDGVIASASLNVMSCSTPAMVRAKLCADSSGSSGSAIGNASSDTWIGNKGGVTLAFTSGPSVTQGTSYWIVFECVSGQLVADIDVCADSGSFSSGRGSEPLSNNVPNSDDWRVEIRYD